MMFLFPQNRTELLVVTTNSERNRQDSLSPCLQMLACLLEISIFLIENILVLNSTNGVLNIGIFLRLAVASHRNPTVHSLKPLAVAIGNVLTPRLVGIAHFQPFVAVIWQGVSR